MVGGTDDDPDDDGDDDDDDDDDALLELDGFKGGVGGCMVWMRMMTAAWMW